MCNTCDSDVTSSITHISAIMQRRSRKGSTAKGRRRSRSPRSGLIFGRNLRRVCRSRRLTAASLAKLIGRSQQSVERMLEGRASPGLAVIGDIARKLKVPLADLVRSM